MESDSNTPLTGESLRVIRVYLQLTLEEVAREMGFGNRAYLCKIENGRVQMSEDQANKIRSAMLKAARKRQRLIGSRLRELELTA